MIGADDWAAHRIVSDAMRALVTGEPIPLRNPTATRPWQHVLEAALQHWAGSWRDGSDPHAPTRPAACTCRSIKPTTSSAGSPAGVLSGGSGGLAKAAPGW